MLKEQAKLFHRITACFDILVIIGSFALAFHVRRLQGGLAPFQNYAWVLLFILPVWYFLLARYGLYASLRTCRWAKIVASLAKTHAVGGVISASLIFAVEPSGYSRRLFGLFLFFSFLFMTFEKLSMKFLLGLIRRRGLNYRNILIVGTDEKALKLLKLMEHHADWGLRVVGFLRLPGENHSLVIAGYNVLGELKDLVASCKFYAVDEVVFCLPRSYHIEVEEYLRDMEEMGVTVRMVLDFYDAPRSRRELSIFHHEFPMVTFYSKAFNASQLFLKRCLDIVGALVGLILIVLTFPFIAIAIKLDSPGPIFFGQKRVGESGRLFTCLKFRSMYIDAEKRKKELLHLNEMDGAIFKIKDDPRITKVGKFLRKTSLDELPQFWNVLRGEMSLVGTRPPTPDEVAKYENWHRRRICIRPGITGLWQVSGRNEIQDFDAVVSLDLEYIDQWSLWLDIKILFKTFWVVFARSGS